VVARYAKHHLPNYGVFDEFRYFVPGDTLPVVRLHGVDIAMTICEDMWQDGGPFSVAGVAGVGLIACINASPYEQRKDDARADLVATRARDAGTTVAFVNTVGGQDELVFDGDSLVMSPQGGVIARGPQFVEDLLVVDLDLPVAASTFEGDVDAGDGTTMAVSRIVLDESPVPAYEPVAAPTLDRLDDCEEVWRALLTGTAGYVEKNHFRTVVLGLSGGIDSAVVATIAADALGADRVHVVGLPSRYSSEGSVSDAEELATRQGLHWTVMPVHDVVTAFESGFASTPTGGLHGLAEENLQARVRGVILMALSNECGHLVLTTGNKSEIATGFSTLYGDSAGGFAPIKDVPKTLVWALARWRNADAEVRGEKPPIPENSISKPPSAELRPGQLDTDSLPDYELLDAILQRYVDGDQGVHEIVAEGFDEAEVARVVALVDRAEWKRRQYPPGTKISYKNFGKDRRLPITNRWRESPTP
jgi:NAD+ synthase (glutamine-hydrolysing)